MALQAIKDIYDRPPSFGAEPRRLSGTEECEHYRDLAERLARTLCATAQRDLLTGAVTWQSTHRARSGGEAGSLNSGNAGTILALAELASELKDDNYRDTLARAAINLCKQPPGDKPLPGLYVGQAGIGAALLRAGQVLNDSRLISGAVERSQFVAALPYGSPDLFNGTAGRLRFHLLVWDETGEEEHLEAAIEAGEALIRGATPSEGDGYQWVIPPGYERLSGRAYLGYSHGAAGIADTLLDLYSVTADQRYLCYAQGAGYWLERQAVATLEEGSGVGWPSRAGEDIYASFWCHGATGIGRFFLRAAKLKALPRAVGLARRAALSAARGVRWASTTQCHGLPSSIEFLLDMYQWEGDQAYLNEALSLGMILEAFAVEKDGLLVWPSESPMVFSPDYMVGYAGVAVCLLRLSTHGFTRHLLTLPHWPRTSNTRTAWANNFAVVEGDLLHLDS